MLFHLKNFESPEEVKVFRISQKSRKLIIFSNIRKTKCCYIRNRLIIDISYSFLSSGEDDTLTFALEAWPLIGQGWEWNTIRDNSLQLSCLSRKHLHGPRRLHLSNSRPKRDQRSLQNRPHKPAPLLSGTEAVVRASLVGRSRGLWTSLANRGSCQLRRMNTPLMVAQHSSQVSGSNGRPR